MGTKLSQLTPAELDEKIDKLAAAGEENTEKFERAHEEWERRTGAIYLLSAAELDEEIEKLIEAGKEDTRKFELLYEEWERRCS